MVLALHGYNYSVYLRIVRLTLAEKGVGYERVEINPFAPDVPASYLALHPFGRVPALVHDGFALYETSAITRYIDRAFPGRALQPTAPQALARMDQIIAIVDSYGYWPMVRQVFSQRVFRPRVGQPPDAAEIERGLAASAQVLAALAPLVTRGGPTLADLHLGAMLGYFTLAPEGAALLQRYERLAVWWAELRCHRSRPAADGMRDYGPARSGEPGPLASDMLADATIPAGTVALARRRPTFGLSWRILGLVIAAVLTAELLLFLPSIGRFRLVYLEQLIESGTLAALALDATPDNMVTDEVKRALLNHARVDAVVLREPDKPRRALLNIAPRPDMPTFNLKERGALGLIWDALGAMTRDGAYYTRVGGESMRLPRAMVWIVVDELPMRIAMYDYSVRVLVLSIIIALFTAALLYLALRWLVIRPLQHLSADMVAFRRDPEEARSDRLRADRNDEIGVVDREFQNLQRELRASLRQKSRLAEIGAASNKINHDLRNILSTARLLSDRLASSDDERTRKLAPTIMKTIDRATRLASEAIEYVRDRPMPRLEAFDLSDLVDEVGVILQEQGEDADPNLLRNWVNGLKGECKVRADRDLLYRVFINLGRNAFDAGASTVTVRTQNGGSYLVVDVADNGPGVPKHVTEQLFKPFTTGGRAGGAGLGLAIARDLVRCHGGEIAMTETGPEGTTFRFTLPASAH